ncbi:hypothetical protein OEA41_008271 [Lepraria neglecta]|uniref:Ubiquinol-cytochrome c chaperone domain-containing protein n=1 Tax=Lepraria neglecta TaxID=209136 RepID=A0AAD9ZF31_9LECA|nr:hypothetical protein OEA41_008271 [Lepraria neglecta]
MPSSVTTATPKFARTLSTSQPLFAVEAKPKPREYAADPAPPTSKSPAVSKESPQPAQEAEIATDSPTRAIAKELRKRASSVTETYVAYGVCEKLVKECARQANYTIPQANEKNVDIPKTKDGEDLGVGTGWWYETLGLTPTFNTWAQITFLHMYLLTARLRSFPPAHAPTWHQHLLDHFFYIAEDRMVTTHNIAARSIRNKYLKDLFVQWRGLMAGYDEGLVKGDAVLATAAWRNVFKGCEEVDFRGVGEVVSYIRGVLRGLDEMGDEAVAGGRWFLGIRGVRGRGYWLGVC